MDNIFKDAEFGSAFLTREGKIAIYQRYSRIQSDDDQNTYYVAHILFTDEMMLQCSDDGTTHLCNDKYDVVSKYNDYKSTYNDRQNEGYCKGVKNITEEK